MSFHSIPRQVHSEGEPSEREPWTGLGEASYNRVFCSECGFLPNLQSRSAVWGLLKNSLFERECGLAGWERFSGGGAENSTRGRDALPGPIPLCAFPNQRFLPGLMHSDSP
jgi:hypothetical protein